MYFCSYVFLFKKGFFMSRCAEMMTIGQTLIPLSILYLSQSQDYSG